MEKDIVQIAKCVLMDIEGLLNELDDEVVSTRREGLVDTIAELKSIVVDSKDGKSWWHENFSRME
jgi:hypothetical protein